MTQSLKEHWQSAKLTTGPMPEASRFDAGPVSLPCPLAQLASENPTLQKIEKHYECCSNLYPQFQIITPPPPLEKKAVYRFP